MDVSPSDGGTVEVNGNILDSFPAALTIANSETVSIKAIPDSNYEFVVWEGSLSGNDNPVDITMTCSKKITANFYRPIYTLTINPSDGGTTTPSVGNHSYYKGTDVSITAIPDDGWQFDGWSGETVESDNATIPLIMDNNKTIQANFAQIMYTLIIEVNGNGSTTPAEGYYSYASGTEVNITATPDDGWKFDGWDDDVIESEYGNNILNINSDITIIADFSPIEVNSSGNNLKWWSIGGIFIGVLIIAIIWSRYKKRTI